MQEGERVKPSFNAMWSAYPTPLVTQGQLYDELGIGALTGDINYANTCGIRMSYTLAKAGHPLMVGGLKIQKGPHKGARLEPGMKRLAAHLETLWGKPEEYADGKAAKAGIGQRRGVIAFFYAPGSGMAQGHIDLVEPAAKGLECAGTCYFTPTTKVSFWPLD